MFGQSLVIMEKYSERIINDLQEKCVNVWTDNTMVGSLFITLVRGLATQSLKTEEVRLKFLKFKLNLS